MLVFPNGGCVRATGCHVPKLFLTTAFLVVAAGSSAVGQTVIVIQPVVPSMGPNEPLPLPPSIPSIAPNEPSKIEPVPLPEIKVAPVAPDKTGKKTAADPTAKQKKHTESN
jgi:hypothetical protein